MAQHRRLRLLISASLSVGFGCSGQTTTGSVLTASPSDGGSQSAVGSWPQSWQLDAAEEGETVDAEAPPTVDGQNAGQGASGAAGGGAGSSGTTSGAETSGSASGSGATGTSGSGSSGSSSGAGMTGSGSTGSASGSGATGTSGSESSGSASGSGAAGTSGSESSGSSSGSGRSGSASGSGSAGTTGSASGSGSAGTTGSASGSGSTGTTGSASGSGGAGSAGGSSAGTSGSAAAVCGDGVCQKSESCATCQNDCPCDFALHVQSANIGAGYYATQCYPGNSARELVWKATTTTGCPTCSADYPFAYTQNPSPPGYACETPNGKIYPIVFTPEAAPTPGTWVVQCTNRSGFAYVYKVESVSGGYPVAPFQYAQSGTSSCP